ELAASGLVSEAVLYESLAEELGIRFSKAISPRDILNGEADCLAQLKRSPGAPSIRLRAKGAATEVAVSTDRLHLAMPQAILAANPALRRRLRMVPPGTLRAAAMAKCRPALQGIAIDRLFAGQPELSARLTTTSWQGYLLGLATLSVPLLFAVYPQFA